MGEKLRAFLSESDDALILFFYAACWLLAFFSPPGEWSGPAAAGGVLATAALVLAVVSWVRRPESRPGWKLRDVSLLFLLALAAIETRYAPIRRLVWFDLLQTLELAALFVVSVYLCVRRPQVLFLVVSLISIVAAAVAWKWGATFFRDADPRALGGAASLSALAALPWLFPRFLRSRRWLRPYGWMVAAAALFLLFAVAGSGGATGGFGFRAVADIPSEARQVVGDLLRSSWLLGCGPGHYEWFYRAVTPAGFATRSGPLPGGVLVVVERGVLGLSAILLFAAAMMWRFRAGPWAEKNREIIAAARLFRWPALYGLVLFLAAPVFASLFCKVFVWSFLGILRGWSSDRPPAAVGLLGAPAGAEPSSAVPPSSWRWREIFLVIGTLVAGAGLVFLHVRPWAASVLRRRPAAMALDDPAYLKRLELAVSFWPHDPRTYELEAVHYRAMANRGKPLTRAQVKAVTRAYERMVVANPYDPLSHHALARWFILQGDLRRAVGAAERGLRYCPASFELQYLLASCWRGLGEMHSALAAYRRAMELKPRSSPVLLNLALLELRLGHSDLARRYLLLAQQVLPGDRAIEATLEAIRSGRIEPLLERSEAPSTPTAKTLPARRPAGP